MPIDYEEEREVGAETALTIAGKDTVRDVPIMNVSYETNVNTSSFQHNNSLYQANAVVGVEYSGSFEHNGSNSEIRDAIRTENGFPVHPQNLTIRVAEYDRTVRFKRCIVESRSKDIPSDDVTSETYDFIAEQMVVDDEGSGKNVYDSPESVGGL